MAHGAEPTLRMYHEIGRFLRNGGHMTKAYLGRMRRMQFPHFCKNGC